MITKYAQFSRAVVKGYGVDSVAGQPQFRVQAAMPEDPDKVHEARAVRRDPNHAAAAPLKLIR